MNKNETTRFAVLCVVTFLIGAVVSACFFALTDTQHAPTSRFWVLSYVMGGVSLICAALMPSRPLAVAPVAIAGVIGGVMFNMFVILRDDSNLWPLAVLMWTGFASPGIFAGSLIGCLPYWIKKKLHNNSPHGSTERRGNAVSSAPCGKRSG